MDGKYSIDIAGINLTFTSDESEAHINDIAKTLDTRIREMTKGNRCNLIDASLLCSMDYCSEMIHAQKKIKNLEAQISLYVANVARLKAEIEELKTKNGDNTDANA